MIGPKDWRDRFPEDVTCVRCLEVTPVQDLDRLLWCDACLERARRRSGIRGWLAGATLAVVLSMYIYFVVQPDLTLIPTAWIATLVVAFYLGSRVAREIFFGTERILNRPAAEATPPGGAVTPNADEGEGAE